MRWFVEISSAGPAAEPPAKLTVEAPQWQPALQKARAMRGDDGSLGNFSIELLDDGYKAVDPVKKLRYTVRKAPDTAELSPGGQAAAEPPKGRPAVTAPPRVAAPPRATPAPAATPLPNHRVLSSREVAATESSPLTYREYVYVVPEGTSVDAGRRVVLDRFEAVKKALDGARGVLVNLAVFDHAYEGKPERAPLVTLMWKDWRGEPEVRPPAPQPSKSVAAPAPAAPRPGSTPPPPQRAVSSPPPAQRSVSTPPARSPSAPPPRAQAGSNPALTPPARSPSAPPPRAQAGSNPALKGGVTTTTKSTPPKARVRTAEELMKELEGASTDLHFLGDALEGADFVVSILKEQLPSELILVWFHDAEKRELVLVRQHGGKHDRLLARMPDRTGLAQAAIANKKALVISDAQRDPRAVDARWKAFGIDPKSIACAPALGGGKTLGLIEIVNPTGGGRYAMAEGNALTYVGKELAEFLTIQGVVLDPEKIRATANKAAAR
ncbi:GAF domain-containing protein [Polyangium jinanense]|uniref:GAF domain-containing protein n=1 Tax=Polyangium jinanense TaxID=2829994 RepID=UPI002340658F|nr:GAF domain-containing protein [Polyangium jinanense]MDC3952572.1 GAF domain-containing protein [Polyangium jinanense]